MIDINLLPPQGVLQQKEEKLKRVLFLAVVVSLAVCLLAGGGLLAAEKALEAQVAASERRKQSLLAEFSSRKATALALRQLQDKAAGIAALKKEKEDFAGRIEAVTKFLGEAVALKSLELGEGGRTKLAASYADGQTLANFLSGFNQGERDLPFAGTVLTSLQLVQGGGFDFSLETKFKQ
jgi:hypothetical protein